MLAVQPIVDNIKWELWSFFSTDAHANNAIIRYINSSLRDIFVQKNFTFNKFKYVITVTSWVTDYTVPNQIETFFILNSQWTKIRFVDFETYYSTIDKSSIIGIWDETFICSMPGTYTILYRGELDPITSLTATINIPSRFYDAIVLEALRYGYMDEKDYTMAAEKKREFDGLIGSLATRGTNVYPTEDVRLWSSYTF